MWRNRGVLVSEDKPAIYVYEEEFTAYGERKSIKGIIARVHLEEFEKGIILRTSSLFQRLKRTDLIL